MPSCRGFSGMMSEELDRPLSWWQRFQLGLHVLGCRSCKRFRKQLRFLTEAIASYLTAKVEPPVLRQVKLLSPEARDRLQQALRRESS